MRSRFDLSIARIVLLTALALSILFLGTLASPPQEAQASHNGTCRVNVSVDIQPDDYNGLPRNNPDGTYFAGDAFDFTVDFDYGGTGTCKDPELDVYTSGDLSISCDSSRYGGCVNGHVEIDPSASIGSHSLQAKGSVKHRHCSLITDTCWWHTHRDSDRYSASVIDPELTVNLKVINMIDSDG